MDSELATDSPVYIRYGNCLSICSCFFMTNFPDNSGDEKKVKWTWRGCG